MQLHAFGDHPILGGRHAQHVHALGGEDLEALRRIEAGVVQQRGGAGEPRRDEHVARRFGPAAGRRAPHQVAGPPTEPVGRLQPLAGQIALSVHDPLGLAGGPAGEGDQARIGGRQLYRRSRFGGQQVVVGDEDHIPLAVDPRRGQLGSRCARRRRSAWAARRPGAGAGPWRAAARCTAGPPRRCESTRPSSAPTRGGCRSASSPRRRAIPRGRPASPRGAPRRRRPLRTSTRGERPRGVISTSARSPGAAASTTSRAKFIGGSLPGAAGPHRALVPWRAWDGRPVTAR